MTRRTGTWITIALLCVSSLTIQVGLRKPPVRHKSILELKCEAGAYEDDYYYVRQMGIAADNRDTAEEQHKAKVDYCVAHSTAENTGTAIPELAAPRAYANSCVGRAQRARDAAQNLAHYQAFATTAEQLERVYSSELTGCAQDAALSAKAVR